MLRCCGRLAPSPTGLLHLGNAWAFLLAWLAARAQGGRVLLRLEDIDPQRSQPDLAAAALEDLRWLGLDWDAGPDVGGPHAPYAQSGRGTLYEAALARLEAAGLTYPCFCTRKELRQMAAAPHVDDRGAPYPGTCRGLSETQRQALLAQGRHAAVRLRCPEDPIDFVDAVQGPQRFTLAACGGDFALRRSDGVVAYQLAVAVDDGLMGVTQVVRGRDILPSTPRQIALLRLLGMPVPAYAHVPLLLDAAGERLAKRHHSLALRELRERGVDARRVVGLLGRLAGCNPSGAALRPQDLLTKFSLATVPRADIRLDAACLRALIS
ncbi:tRNA glutamyl-Q(34) synthetase GluQRS [Desulfovibrio legallii]|uniref:Glutamyl-Q tRNA(Asp) synthetase n=1 Tax=Desulfovibrio legallii TaxID=571438 RepID=A0A1G7PJL3_9BACT|nr:tRNA glutamyl-Q(34) synthetase GluQRS [Desulfovibrio legallii]SDF86408.1 glutamyl-tRNA synthetase [Desulfovibrio legallii]